MILCVYTNLSYYLSGNIYCIFKCGLVYVSYLQLLMRDHFGCLMNYAPCFSTETFSLTLTVLVVGWLLERREVSFSCSEWDKVAPVVELCLKYFFFFSFLLTLPVSLGTWNMDLPIIWKYVTFACWDMDNVGESWNLCLSCWFLSLFGEEENCQMNCLMGNYLQHPSTCEHAAQAPPVRLSPPASERENSWGVLSATPELKWNEDESYSMAEVAM